MVSISNALLQLGGAQNDYARTMEPQAANLSKVVMVNLQKESILAHTAKNTLLWLETEILGRPLEPQDTSFTHCPNGDGSCSMANEGVPQVLKRTKSKADELLLRSKKKKKQSGANNKVTGKKSSSAMLEDNMKRLKSAVSKALKTKMDKQDPRFRTACDQTFRMANIRLQGLDEDAFKHRSVATAEMNAAVFATLETLL